MYLFRTILLRIMTPYMNIVGLLSWGIGPLQGRYLNNATQ